MIFTSTRCNSNVSSVNDIKNEQEPVVLVPFLPGSCHQCSSDFYQNLQLLEKKKVEYSILLSEDYVDDLDYIKSEYKLSKYNVKDYIFSTKKFEKYRLYEQNYVLTFDGSDDYGVFENAEGLTDALNQLKAIEKVSLRDYSLKTSTANIFFNGSTQLCIQNSVQKDRLDLVELNGNSRSKTVAIDNELLEKNYLAYFKDKDLASSKLFEITQVTDVPNKDVFDMGIYHRDSLLFFSKHTYIGSLKDSILGGFKILNIYKDGNYLTGRTIDEIGIPSGYFPTQHFHIFKEKLYIKMVREHLRTDSPNYFIGVFELKDSSYKFSKLLSFNLPDIHNDVGYSFVELKFSDKYFMTSISNLLFNIETEQIDSLNIPVNSKVEIADLIANLRGVNIVIDNIEIKNQFINIVFYSKDKNANGNVIAIKYDLSLKKVVGKRTFSLENTRFVKPDNTKFGYYFWTPQKGKNEFLYYGKLL